MPRFIRVGRLWKCVRALLASRAPHPTAQPSSPERQARARPRSSRGNESFTEKPQVAVLSLQQLENLPSPWRRLQRDSNTGAKACPPGAVGMVRDQPQRGLRSETRQPVQPLPSAAP